MKLEIARECIEKHFISPALFPVISSTFDKKDADFWEEQAIEIHRDREAMGVAAANKNTVIVLNSASWKLLADNELFSCSMTDYYQKLDNPSHKVLTILTSDHVLGVINTTKGGGDIRLESIDFSPRYFVFSVNFTDNGVEINHFESGF